MNKEYCFSNGTPSDFMYVYSPIVKIYPTFCCDGNCLYNRFDKEQGDYEYISIVTREKYKKATLTAVCDFHKYGAPLLVFGNDIAESVGKDGNRHLFYGVHFEVVAWENGCNIWYLQPYPEREEHPVKPTKILAKSFKINENTPIEISVTVESGKLSGEINGIAFSVEHPEIPGEFHIGYTACEGINKLYKLTLNTAE